MNKGDYVTWTNNDLGFPRSCKTMITSIHHYNNFKDYLNSEGMNKKTWRRARKLSDKVFLWGMKSADPKVSAFKIYSAYWSVRLFGRWPASSDMEKN